MKGIIAFIAFLAVLIVGLGLWVATPQGGGGLGQDDGPTNVSRANQQTPADRDDGVVTIKDRKFKPKTARVLANTSVTFTNRDNTAHGVDFDDKKLKDRPRIPAGGLYAVEMPGKGRFAYHCPIHPEMKGAIVVNAQ